VFSRTFRAGVESARVLIISLATTAERRNAMSVRHMLELTARRKKMAVLILLTFAALC